MGQIIDHIPQDITPPCKLLTVNGICTGAKYDGVMLSFCKNCPKREIKESGDATNINRTETEA